MDRGIVPVADVVVNHRQGTNSWAVFKNPAFPSDFICSNDEFWSTDPTKFINPLDLEIQQSGKRGGPDYAGSDFPNWPGARDLDHENPKVRSEVISYLRRLQWLGNRGWRYDMVKGFDPKHVGEYNQQTRPYFSVGEYWDGNPGRIKQWIKGTFAGTYNHSYAFDFPTYYGLRDAIHGEDFRKLEQITKRDGLIATAATHAVTFLENHDTGWPQKSTDTFQNDEKLMQAYAYLLTHPGIPTVFWKHFDEWGRGEEIASLIHARHRAKIGSTSGLISQIKGRNYFAFVGEKGQNPSLVVQIGEENVGEPDPADWEVAASGEGYRVWVRRFD